MKAWPIPSVVVLLLSACMYPLARATPTPGNLPNQPLYIDNDYRNALRVVNDVLAAWYRRKSRPELLTSRVKEKYSQQQIDSCFVGLSTPQNWAFEVVGKERVNPDRWRFYVWTHEYVTAENRSVPHGPPSEFDVVRVGSDKWLADTLPCGDLEPSNQ